MRSFMILSLFSGIAAADTLTGKLDDPALRRKVEMVYVEKVANPQQPPANPITINQKDKTYVPHITVVVPGTKIVFKSEDTELHNVYARGEKKVIFNDAVLPQMQSAPKVFSDLGIVHLTCNVHREMNAWVFVLQNTFWAKPEKDGTFKIEGLPPGSYTIHIWGEQLSDEQKAKTFKYSVGGAS